MEVSVSERLATTKTVLAAVAAILGVVDVVVGLPPRNCQHQHHAGGVTWSSRNLPPPLYYYFAAAAAGRRRGSCCDYFLT